MTLKTIAAAVPNVTIPIADDTIATLAGYSKNALPPALSSDSWPTPSVVPVDTDAPGDDMVVLDEAGVV